MKHTGNYLPNLKNGQFDKCATHYRELWATTHIFENQQFWKSAAITFNCSFFLYLLALQKCMSQGFMLLLVVMKINIKHLRTQKYFTISFTGQYNFLLYMKLFAQYLKHLNVTNFSIHSNRIYEIERWYPEITQLINSITNIQLLFCKSQYFKYDV